MDLITKTDPDLPPKARYCLIVNEYLQNDGFKYLKSKSRFVKRTPNGKIELTLSFIHTINLVHAVGYYFHYIFDDIEKEFEKLFGKIWTNWTVHINMGYVNTLLYDDSGYSDNSISKAVADFLQVQYPKVLILENRFNTKDRLVEEYTSTANEFVDFVPSGRLERRVLMCLMLAKMFRINKYSSILERSNELIEKYKGTDKGKQEERIQNGIVILNTLG